MNLKPTKINPINVSPCTRSREPLRDIINLNRLPTPKQAASQRKISHGQSHYRGPRLDQIDIQSIQNSIASKSRSQRHSLKPMPEDQFCANHPDKLAKFKAVSEEIDLYYCEKCAILLASQGFKVQRLERMMNTPSSSRLRIASSFSQINLNNPNSKFVSTSYAFVEEVNTFLEKCEQIKTRDRDQRSKVFNYYTCISKQIDEFEEELKTSIAIMMDEQRKDIQGLFEEIDKKFNFRCTEIQAVQSELSSIVRDITENIHTIGTLSESEFTPAINKYRLTLDQAIKRIQVHSEMEHYKLEMLNPKAQNLKHLADIIGQCRYKLRHKKTESQPQQPQKSHKPSMFFSFHKLIPKDKQQKTSSCRLSDLEAKVNVIMTNSDSEGDGECELQESIVDVDFSKLVNGG